MRLGSIQLFPCESRGQKPKRSAVHASHHPAVSVCVCVGVFGHPFVGVWGQAKRKPPVWRVPYRQSFFERTCATGGLELPGRDKKTLAENQGFLRLGVVHSGITTSCFGQSRWEVTAEAIYCPCCFRECENGSEWRPSWFGRPISSTILGRFI